MTPSDSSKTFRTEVILKRFFRTSGCVRACVFMLSLITFELLDLSFSKSSVSRENLLEDRQC